MAATGEIVATVPNDDEERRPESGGSPSLLHGGGVQPSEEDAMPPFVLVKRRTKIGPRRGGMVLSWVGSGLMLSPYRRCFPRRRQLKPSPAIPARHGLTHHCVSYVRSRARRLLAVQQRPARLSTRPAANHHRASPVASDGGRHATIPSPHPPKAKRGKP